MDEDSQQAGERGTDGDGDSEGRRAGAVRAGQDSALGVSLQGLALLATRPRGLDEVLTSVASLAVRAIPGADGAGLTLLERGRPDTIVATETFVREVDAVQYGLGQGPCIRAAAEGRTMWSGSLGSDERWQLFGSTVARLGVHSVISLPLVAGQMVLGAMNVYAHVEDAFDERAVELGELFAVPAAVAVQNAHALAQAERLVTQLQAAVSTRAVIDRAVGIILARGDVTESEALERLRAVSMSERLPLAVVAQQLVDTTLRRHRNPFSD